MANLIRKRGLSKLIRDVKSLYKINTDELNGRDLFETGVSIAMKTRHWACSVWLFSC